MSRLRELFGLGSDTTDSLDNVPDRHERAKEQIKQWDDVASELIYCELCEQVFTSYDIFWDHRRASESELARETYDADNGLIGEQFRNYRELTAGDEFPEGATLGEITPCEPKSEKFDFDSEEVDR